MSHELRTPLNSSLILAGQLAGNPDGNLTGGRSSTPVIHSAGTDLLNLLNDILDLAKVESNTVRLEIDELSLAELRESLLRLPPDRGGAGLASRSRSTAVPETMVHRPPPAAPGPEEPARQRVQVHRERRASSADPWHRGWSRRVSRRADRHRDRRQRHRSGSRELQHHDVRGLRPGRRHDRPQDGGTGLGPSISRNLVDLLGGEIALTSEPGRGARYRLPAGRRGERRSRPAPGHGGRRAPRPNGNAPVVAMATGARGAVQAPALARRRRRDTEERSTGQAAGTTVLIVDDDFRNIFALTALLERGSIDVVAAESGAGGARRSSTSGTDIDIVLMDIMMPVMNGYETMEAIRRRPGCAELPIIAVTGKVVGGERERCLAAGASDYIPKPVDSAELLAA